eukprot:gb/GEZN01003701.1/.p1 GENE.gb/GEZN01003701.1/~~gb/GEZN01003701.1/.p1  ORF type:complete len:484 (-),score=58.23 gb/GEZN01003701.1/:1-1452(-)
MGCLCSKSSNEGEESNEQTPIKQGVTPPSQSTGPSASSELETTIDVRTPRPQTRQCKGCLGVDWGSLWTTVKYFEADRLQPLQHQGEKRMLSAISFEKDKYQGVGELYFLHELVPRRAKKAFLDIKRHLLSGNWTEAKQERAPLTYFFKTISDVCQAERKLDPIDIGVVMNLPALNTIAAEHLRPIVAESFGDCIFVSDALAAATASLVMQPQEFSEGETMLLTVDVGSGYVTVGLTQVIKRQGLPTSVNVVAHYSEPIGLFEFQLQYMNHVYAKKLAQHNLTLSSKDKIDHTNYGRFYKLMFALEPSFKMVCSSTLEEVDLHSADDELCLLPRVKEALKKAVDEEGDISEEDSKGDATISVNAHKDIKVSDSKAMRAVRTLIPQVLKSAPAAARIDRVVLCGGGFRCPSLRAELEQLKGNIRFKPTALVCELVSATEGCAIGCAAIAAAIWTPKDMSMQLALKDQPIFTKLARNPLNKILSS